MFYAAVTSDSGRLRQREMTMTLYLFFKFAHVVAAMVWLGGAVSLAVFTTRSTRATDPAALAMASDYTDFLGARVLGPSALVTLLAGLTMVGLTGWRVSLWLGWGLAGVLGSMILGAAVLGPAARRVADLAAAAWGDPGALRAARRRLSLWGAVNLLLLVSTVWAMVTKPTL